MSTLVLTPAATAIPPVEGLRAWWLRAGAPIALGLTVAAVVTRVSSILEETTSIPSFIVPLCLAFTVATLGSRLVEGRHPLELFGRATVLVMLFVALMLAIRLPGLVLADDPATVMEGIVVLAKDCLVAVGVVYAAERTGALLGAVRGIVVAGGGLALLTVHKALTGNIGDDYLGFSRATDALVSATENGTRYTGPFDDPNFYAQTLTVVVALAAVRFWHTGSTVERLAMAGVLAPTLLALTYTLSRGGMVASVVVIVGSIVRRFGRRGLVAVAIGGLVMLPLLPSTITERVLSLAEAPAALIGSEAVDPSIQGRTSETLVGVDIFLDHPLVGVGLGNYELNYLDYSTELGLDPRRTERAAHNLFLEVAAELGIVGLTGFVVIVGAAVLVPGAVGTRLRGIGDHDRAATAHALQLAMVGYLITALFLHDAFPRIFVILVALALSSVMLESQSLLRPEPQAPRRLRVVQLIDSLATGGAERLIVEFGSRADGLDVDVQVVSLATPNDSPVRKDLLAAGVDIQHVPPTKGRGLLDRRRLSCLNGVLDDLDPDVVHLHLETSTILGGRVARKLGIPTVVTLHNTEPNVGRLRRPKLWLLRRALRRSDRVLAVGTSVARAWQAPLADVPIEVVRNPTRWSPVVEGARADRPTLIAVGRLAEQKAYPDLLAAMTKVVSDHPLAHLLIAGDGPDRPNLEALVAELGLQRSVTLLGVRDDVGRLLQASDLFVMSSLWEGLPLALLEAMSVGLPVVATQVGDIGEIVPSDAGSLVEPGDVDALAAAISAYLADDDGRVAAGRAGRHYVETNHHPDVWAAGLVDRYVETGMQLEVAR